MMNGYPNMHQQPPMPGGQPRMPLAAAAPSMGNGPVNPQMNHIYGGGAPGLQLPKQNVVPVPGGYGPPQPSMMPINSNKQQYQPPVPASRLPPTGNAFSGSSVAPPVPTMNSQPPPTAAPVQQQQQQMMSRPAAGMPQMAAVPPPPTSLSVTHQNGLISASSSRTASPLPTPTTTSTNVNRIPSGQLPPNTNNNNVQTPNRLEFNPNATTGNLNANFTPLKASTPQYGSPAVGGGAVAGPPQPNPGQLMNNMQQAVQNMNLNYNGGGGGGGQINGTNQQLQQQQVQKPQIPPPTTSNMATNPNLGPVRSGPVAAAAPPQMNQAPPPPQQQGQMPPQIATTNSNNSQGYQQPRNVGMPPQPISQQQQPGNIAPPMVNRYPPQGTQQQSQQQQQYPPPLQQQQPPQMQLQSGYPGAPTAAAPLGGMRPAGMSQNYPPMPPAAQPAGVFGQNSQQQPLQYQSQMPPQQQQQQQRQMHPYPQQGQGQPPGSQFQNQVNNNNNIQRGNLSVTQSGFNRLWGTETVDLLQNRHILPPEPVQPPAIKLNNQFYESVNCSPEVFRCTLTKIPETKELLNKSRLPMGVLIHPFRDINKLPVIQCSEIVRCRACRTYINPFVYFVDSMKWKCNLCYRVNELPKEFQYDPISKTYGDVTRRPEVKSSTIEFIASSEYMLRPPPPAIYLFLLDVSSIAVQSGYLNVVCQQISDHLDELPGDARTQVGFVAFNSAIHFYNIAESFNQPHEITVLDVDDVFLPCPDNLLVNLKECKELIKDLLVQLPKRFGDAHDPKSALGAALQAAFKMIGSTGGRVTVFQTCLPNEGPGALQSREDPNNRSSKDVPHLGPATDFYKRMALECSGQQISVDLFILNSQYSDIATLAGISKYSGGCMHHIPLFNHTKAQQVDSLKACLERYLTRKIGFEAVMRIRCTRGLSIHTFHGNFFVRSTDLLSLPNVNPDAGFAMQISHEESLTDLKTVCFQAALLYTSSKAERRIRVHTLCLPVVNQLSDVLTGADSQAIAGLLVKMAVDRSLTSTLADAREAFINATVDILSAFKLAQNLPAGQVIAPMNLALLPLYINAIMKHVAFRTGTSTRLDDRAFAMCEMKSMPLGALIRYIYPDFYNIDCLFENLQQNGGGGGGEEKASEEERPDPPRLQLSAEKLDSRSIFLMDTGPHIMIYVGTNANPHLVQKLFGVEHVGGIPDLCYTLLNNNTPESEALFAFIDYINEDKPYPATIQIIRDSSSYRAQFTEKFVDDRTESALSYYEFLQHLRTQVK